MENPIKMDDLGETPICANPTIPSAMAAPLQAPRELTGTFDNAKLDGSRAYLPAYLRWNHSGCEAQ